MSVMTGSHSITSCHIGNLHGLCVDLDELDIRRRFVQQGTDWKGWKLDEVAGQEPVRGVLRELWELVGEPSYDSMATRRPGLSKSNVGNLIKGSTSPRTKTVKTFIEVCLAIGGRKLLEEQNNADYWLWRYQQSQVAKSASVDVVVAGYLETLRRQFGRLQLDTLIPHKDQDDHPPVHLRDVFVGQDVRANPPRAELPRDLWLRLIDSGHVSSSDLPAGLDRELITQLRQSYRQRPRRSVLSVLAHPSSTRTVLLGDPGAGKSTLARYLSLALAEGLALSPELEPLRGKVPLVVELRIYASDSWSGDNFLDLLDHLHTTEGLGLPRLTAEALLVRGEALVIFDGLDEVFDPGERTRISKRIGAFATKYPRSKVIVTSRVIGYQRNTLDSAGFAHYKLEDLNTAQIERFVQRWYDTAVPNNAVESARLQRRLLTAMADSKAIAELAGNPLLVTILTIIGKRQALPKARRDVLKHAVTVLVQHWDPEKDMLPDRFSRDLPTIVEEDKMELLRRVARRMQAAPAGLAGNHITGADLREEFEQYLRVELELPAHQARPGAEQMLEQFRHRNFILSRFGPGVYGFVHRAFLEYMAAKDVELRFAKRKLDETDLLELFTTRWNDPAWHEVLRHITGMLDTEFAKMVIEHLLTLNPLWRTRKRSLPHHIVLALQCLSEVHRTGSLGDANRRVMEALTEAIEIASIRQQSYENDLVRLLESSVLPTLGSINPYWAGREVYQTWFAEHHRSLTLQAEHWYTDTLVLATRIAVQLSDDSSELRAALIEQASSDSTPAVRKAAIAGLASTEQEIPEVCTLLRTLVVANRESDVGAAALAALKPWLKAADANWVRGLVVEGSEYDLAVTAVGIAAEKWADDEKTLPWLQDLIESDIAARPATEALASRWSPDGEVLSWLQSAVENTLLDTSMAVEAIGSGWAHLPGVRSWLVDLAESGAWPTRAAAVEAIASAWRGDPDIVAWLRERAALEISPDVRRSAVVALGDAELSEEIEHDLRLWARKDPTADIRRVAVNALGKHSASSDLRQWLRDTFAVEQDDHVRSTVVTLLSEMGLDSDWAKSIAESDPGVTVRRHAAEAVVQAAEPDLLEWLTARLQAEPDSYSRAKIVEMIVLASPDHQSTLNWLHSGNNGLDALDVVAGSKVRWLHEPWFEKLIQNLALPGNTFDERITAIDLMDCRRSEASKKILGELTKSDTSPVIRHQALSRILRATGHSKEETMLVSSFLPEGEVATHAAFFWHLSQEAGSSPGLRAWLTSITHSESGGEIQDDLVRRLGLISYRYGFAQELLVHIAEKHTSRYARAEALSDATRRMSSVTAVAWLRERFTNDPAAYVRLAALRELGRMAQDAGLIEWMRDVTSCGEPEAIRVEALIHSNASLTELQSTYVATSGREPQSALLRHIVERWRFEAGVREWFVMTAETIAPATNRATALIEYAENWKRQPGLLDWLWERLSDPSALVRCAAVESISTSWRHVPGVVERLCSLDNEDSIVLLCLLQDTRNWKITAEVTRWTRRLAEEHPVPSVRTAAVQTCASAQGGRPEAVSWLMDRVNEDDDWEPRSIAVLAAALLGGHDPRTLPWTRSLALQDADPMVRSAAMDAWALGWATNPIERAQLAEVGSTDSRSDVRVAAIRALAGSLPGNDEITTWLAGLATDTDPAVRRVAERELIGRSPLPEIPAF